MKKHLPVMLLTTALLSTVLGVSCAEQATKAGGGTASKASPEAMTAIKNAADAIKAAKANDWIWRDTESFLKEAEAAAKKGENQQAIELADKAKFQAESAVIQYNYEREHPRGL